MAHNRLQQVNDKHAWEKDVFFFFTNLQNGLYMGIHVPYKYCSYYVFTV